MDKGYEKERFEKLGIKISVAIRFRQFCKKMSKSQSMTLLLMIDFFEGNGISPAESMGPHMETLEKRMSLLIKKRINGMIAIMKDIEKNQTKPTVAMIQSLFEEAEPSKKKLILEKEIPKQKNEIRFREKLKNDNEL
ncbi:BfmA/BtgA family mobilization protein [Aquimarina sp. I32.4]|uniref:BfmA/BtgA family mobilization protein n=1 Tax=Aquimarina sp. I32.4 TaxID=2053903 RepID=UPI0018EC32DB|nr:BfmA/BtgA family mobilization protein [Aquimarina sp. I32.4]